MLDAQTIKKNVFNVAAQVEAIAEKTPFKEKVYIVAASKTMPIECVKAVEETPVFAVAENKAQEFRDKYTPLDGVEWQFIGRLQTNKVKYLVGKASLIQSIDGFELLDEVERLAEKMNITQDVLLEISVSGEQSKGGIPLDKVGEYLEYIENLSFVKCKGFMSVMPNIDDKETLKKYFKTMRSLFDETKKKELKNTKMVYLSCGMSSDYTEAVECGANMIRLGRTVFGEREYKI